MNNTQSKFLRYIAEHQLFNKQNKLLVAVSGGLDSVVLCHLLNECGFDFEMAHCNFQLRGDESKRDEAFVIALAEKLNKKLQVISFDTVKIAKEEKTSIEETARNLRYNWFATLAPTTPILTAHHANDNVETVLMNFFRGTGIKGLRGILPKQQNIVRPLLDFAKEEIVAYAKEHKLDYVEDSSNASNNYTRNYFRNELIPAIEKVYPAVFENIRNNIERHYEIEKVFSHSISQQKEMTLEEKGKETWAPILKLQKLPSASAFMLEWLSPFGFSAGQLLDVTQLMQSDNGKYVASATHQIFKNRKHLILAPIVNEDAAHYIVDEDLKNLTFEQGTLQFNKSDNISFENDAQQALLDASQLEFPLILRKWRIGDYFYPLGMKHKKKLSKFFIDLKLSPTEKQNVWVLESNQKIIWVVGYRIDDRFKLKEHSNKALKIKLGR